METTGAYRQNFSAKWNLGTPFAITNEGLVYGNTTYPYSRLSAITLITAPANSLLNGVAQVTVDHRNVLQLCYEYSQHQAFLQAMGYANEQINQQSANTKKYKYLLQAENGNKVEVYDSYLVLYCDDSGIMTALKLVKQSTVLTRTIMLADLLDVVYTAPTDYAPGSLCFLDREMPQPESKNTITVSFTNAALAQSIADYVAEYKHSDDRKSDVLELPHLEYEPVIGTELVFPFMGSMLTVPAEVDVANTYRKNYRQLATACVDRFKQQYQMKIHDYRSFMLEFPNVYNENMEPLLQYSMDVLIAEDIWTITKEAFTEAQKAQYNRGYADFEAMYNAGQKTVEANKQYVATATNMPKITHAGGFGFSNAMKAMNKANAYNTLSDLLSKTTQSNTTMNTAQQWELFNRLNLENIALRVYCDYWNMWLLLIGILQKNGKNYRTRITAGNNDHASIFQNLSNPNFPQDRIPGILLEIIQANPYKKDYYVFMKKHFGETEEVNAICEYFGYGDLNDPRTL